MERLTKKISKTIQGEYSLGSYSCYDFAKADDVNKLLNKLGQFEDFMEANKFESLEELKINIEYLKDKIKTDKFNYEQLHKFKNHLQQENQAIKDKIQDLELADLIRKKEK